MADLDFAKRICGADVHVWVVDLEASPPSVRELASTLSSDEKDRATSFKFEHLATRFRVCRGLLRTFLAAYLRTAPNDIEFLYGKCGKPFVAGVENFHFNLAHSEEMAVYAFAWGCDLGVDIERIRDIRDIGAIARHFFCPEEVADLSSVNAGERLEAFFACWTRKEAYIKATGEGLSASLDSFRVALQPREPPSFVHINGSVLEADLWSLHSFRPNEDQIGALAVPDRRKLRFSERQPVDDLLIKIARRTFLD
jgi:4'-phosphopantetheinyl transferase